jgi:2-keto-3-deoxy-L-rhamnonate aldolase RhmA
MELEIPQSKVRARLEAGEWVFGASVLPDAWHIDMLGIIGFDFAWIDAEHGSLNDRDLNSLCLAARGAGYEAIVRFPQERMSDCYRALEAGAAGIMVPHCDSVQDARTVVRNARFPPLGERSYSGTGVDARYGLIRGRHYMEEADRQSLVVVQIESPQAVEAAPEIASVRGVDLLMVGSVDLSVSLGTPLEFGSRRFRAALSRVAEACGEAGKWWGLLVTGKEQAKEARNMGASFMCYGSPRRVLLSGYRALRAEFDTLA